MAAPEVHQLSHGPLTGVAFGPDRSRMFSSPFPLCSKSESYSYTEVAVCPNNNEAQIYTKSGDTWELQQTLAEVNRSHSQEIEQS